MQQNGSPIPSADPDPTPLPDLQEREKKQAEAGQEEEKVTWDGTEVELVADHDAADYEEEFTGLKIRYMLTEEDLYACLKASNPFKTSGVRAGVQTAVLSLFGILFFVTYFLESPRQISSLVFGAICFALIAAIWIVPYGALKSRAKGMVTGKTVVAEIFPDEIQIGEGEGAWTIPLDGTSWFQELEDLFVIRTPQNRLAVFPIRSIEPAMLPEIQAMLMSGTIPEPKKGRKKKA